MTGDAAAAIHWWPIRSRALNDTAGIVLCVYGPRLLGIEYRLNE